jgi:hypothetical protein
VKKAEIRKSKFDTEKMHISRVFLLALLCFMTIVGACKRSATAGEQDKATNVKLEPRLPEEPPTVMFGINSVNNQGASAGMQLYDCIYTSGGKSAKFRLEWKQHGALSGDIPMASAEGRFLAVDDSDNSALLLDLNKALEAKEIPNKPSRVKELAFDAAVLGEHQSRDASGAYSDNPRGDWVLLKLFLPKGGDDGEVFLNLNPVLGKAEFSIKDSDYGDFLMEQLAKVL